MMDIVNKLRESRKSPTVLHHQLVSIRSTKPNLIVLFFEGIEDIGVYETWIQRCNSQFDYEAIPGKGKEQLLALREYLITKGSDLHKGVYFFVDSDFDPLEEIQNDLFCLDAYSIENILCSKDSLNSILRDEFSCTGDPAERKKICDLFEDLLETLNASSREINFRLFLARRKNVDVLSKPDDARDFCTIGLESLTLHPFDIEELVKLNIKINECENLLELRQEFENLNALQSQRGKYVLSFFRSWIQALADDKKSISPKLFKTSNPKLSGQPWSFKLRRLASASPIPSQLESFLNGILNNQLEITAE